MLSVLIMPKSEDEDEIQDNITLEYKRVIKS